MGIYIDWPDRLKIGKAERLRNDHAAEDFAGEDFAAVPEGKVLVAVLENREGQTIGGMVTEIGSIPLKQEHNFDAALVVFDQEEWDRLAEERYGQRTIHRLLIDRDEAVKLAPALQSVGL